MGPIASSSDCNRQHHRAAGCGGGFNRQLFGSLHATLFGVCPWETLLTPTQRFFRLGGERVPAGAPAISRA